MATPRSVAAGRPPNKRLIGNRKGRGPGTSVLVAEVQGANAVADHLIVIGQLFDQFAPAILDIIADVGIEVARDFVPSPEGYPTLGLGRNPGNYPNFGRYATGATWESINKAPGVISKPGRAEYSVRVGPTTFYAPFLEYGTIWMSPRPFMMPAGDVMEKLLFESFKAFAKLVGLTHAPTQIGNVQGPSGNVLADQRVHSPFTQARSFLYSTSKFLGDISVFGGREMFGPARALTLSLARSLGDVSAIMSGAIGSRVTNRLGGRVTGKISGFGSASLQHSKSYSGFAGGASGHRIYQRVVGRFGSQTSFTNLGFSNNFRGF